MPRPDLRKSLPAAIAFILPAIVVKVATTFLGQTSVQSAEASAATAAVTPTLSPKKEVALTAKQVAAAQHIESLRDESFNPAPLVFEPDNAPASTPGAESPAPSNEPPPVPKFTLSAIMGSTTTRRALVNGVSCSEGDLVKGTTWLVISIDPAKRSVALRDTQSDRTLTIGVDSPK